MKPLFKLKLKQISPYRWLLAFIFLIITNTITVVCSIGIPFSSKVDAFLFLSSDFYLICFYLLFVIIVLTCDYCAQIGTTYENTIAQRLMPRKRYAFNCCLYIFLISAIIVLLQGFILSSIILIFYRQLPLRELYYLHNFGLSNTTYIQGLALLVTLQYCRVCFIILGIATTNAMSKRPVGFFFGITVTVMDWWFYELFQIMEPLSILPIEHTRIMYTEAVAPAIETVKRIPFFFSFLYWFVLIGIEVIGLFFIIYKKDYLKNSYLS